MLVSCNTNSNVRHFLHRADISTSASATPGTTFSSSTNHRISRSSWSTSFTTSRFPWPLTIFKHQFPRHRLEEMLLLATTGDEHGGGGTSKGTARPTSILHIISISAVIVGDSLSESSFYSNSSTEFWSCSDCYGPLSPVTSFQTSSS